MTKNLEMHFSIQQLEVEREREERERERERMRDSMNNLQIINRVFKVITEPRLPFII